MTTAETYFTQLTDQIPGAQPGKMFGALCMKMPNGKSAAMFWKDCIIVKLTGTAHDEALQLSGAIPFEPHGRQTDEGMDSNSFQEEITAAIYFNLKSPIAILPSLKFPRRQ